MRYHFKVLHYFIRRPFASLLRNNAMLHLQIGELVMTTLLRQLCRQRLLPLPIAALAVGGVTREWAGEAERYANLLRLIVLVQLL